MRLPVLIIGIALIAALAALRFADPAPISALRLSYFDALQRVAPRTADTPGVRVVDIDEGSLEALGQWPWPRDRLARLTGLLADAGVAAIAFDMIFAEPDRLSPTRLATNPDVAPILRGRLTPDELSRLDTDLRFAGAIGSAPVVLGIARTGRKDGPHPVPKAGTTIIGASANDALPELGATTPLVPDLAEAAKGIGAISVGPGANTSVLRTVPLLWSGKTGPIPSLALETLRVALGADGFVLWETDGIPGTVDRISVGSYEIPTTPDGQLWLRARPAASGSYIPASDILLGGEVPDLTGAIVFVGTSAAGLLDLHTTALGETVPGVTAHAQAAQQILSGDHLVRSDYAGGLELMLFLSAGLLVAAVMSLSGPGRSVIVGLAAAGATVVASWIAFSSGGLLIDATFPLIGTVTTFSLLTLYRLFVTDRDARRVRRSFSRYVAPDVLREIETSGHNLALGGTDLPVTVMFSDIRNFTALSEALDAQGIVALLNRLFAALSEEIMRQRGTIDKFMGDSVMAFWNAPVPAPDHALRACRAALAMRGALATVNSGGKPIVRTGTGLATGMACIGNIGSRARFNYTAIGETVNAAARLEAACRHVEYDILAGRAVRDAAPALAWLPAGALIAKGVSEPLDASILVGDEKVSGSPDFVALSEAHAALIETLADGKDPADALEACRPLAEAFPGLDGFYDRLPDRAEDFAPGRILQGASA